MAKYPSQQAALYGWGEPSPADPRSYIAFAQETIFGTTPHPPNAVELTPYFPTPYFPSGSARARSIAEHCEQLRQEKHEHAARTLGLNWKPRKLAVRTVWEPNQGASPEPHDVLPREDEPSLVQAMQRASDTHAALLKWAVPGGVL